MTAWLTNNEGRIIGEGPSSVADSDNMNYRVRTRRKRGGVRD